MKIKSYITINVLVSLLAFFEVANSNAIAKGRNDSNIPLKLGMTMKQAQSALIQSNLQRDSSSDFTLLRSQSLDSFWFRPRFQDGRSHYIASNCQIDSTFGSWSLTFDRTGKLTSAMWSTTDADDAAFTMPVISEMTRTFGQSRVQRDNYGNPIYRWIQGQTEYTFVTRQGDETSITIQKYDEPQAMNN